MQGAADDALDPASLRQGQSVVEGVVTRGGAPVANAYVRLHDSDDEFVAEVPTSATGRFRFYVVPGSWTVSVLAPGASARRAAVAGDAVVTALEVVLPQ